MPSYSWLIVNHTPKHANLHKLFFQALRHCVSAGEPLNPEVIQKWNQDTGLTIREGYGQTEMTLSCGMFRCLDVKPGSMGKAAPGYDIQVSATIEYFQILKLKNSIRSIKLRNFVSSLAFLQFFRSSFCTLCFW